MLALIIVMSVQAQIDIAVQVHTNTLMYVGLHIHVSETCCNLCLYQFINLPHCFLHNFQDPTHPTHRENIPVLDVVLSLTLLGC